MFFKRKRAPANLTSSDFDRTLDKSSIEFYRNQGYLIFDTELPNAVLEGVKSDLQRYWDGEKPENVAYYDPRRIQDAWKISDHVYELATNRRILSVLYDLYQVSPRPFQTLNFPVGTEQKVHSDTIHFNSEPFGLMCGVWIALEDIGPGQGPLIYYPGSNQWPEMNFEDLGLEPDYSEYGKYEQRLEEMIENKEMKAHYATISKGQALIWSANLLHGGFKQYDKELTRHSQVTHYFFEGCKPWRPGFSKNKRHYFSPEYIPVQSNAGVDH